MSDPYPVEGAEEERLRRQSATADDDIRAAEREFDADTDEPDSLEDYVVRHPIGAVCLAFVGGMIASRLLF